MLLTKRIWQLFRVEIFAWVYYVPNMLPGYLISNRIRASVLKLFLNSSDSGLNINQDIRFECPWKIVLGKNVGFNTRCWINGSGGLSIGHNTLIGPSVTIVTANHILEPREARLQDRGHILKEVVIGANVWIGAGAIILPGVVIEDNAVIGAGSVVTKRVYSSQIVAGNPALPISRRSKICE